MKKVGKIWFVLILVIMTENVFSPVSGTALDGHQDAEELNVSGTRIDAETIYL